MRTRRTNTEWAALIEAQKESGTTVASFCREKAIHPNVFYRKQKELRQNEQVFVRVQSISRAGESGRIRIGEIEIEAREWFPDDFLVRMIRCVIEAKNAVVSR